MLDGLDAHRSSLQERADVQHTLTLIDVDVLNRRRALMSDKCNGIRMCCADARRAQSRRIAQVETEPRVAMLHLLSVCASRTRIRKV